MRNEYKQTAIDTTLVAERDVTVQSYSSTTHSDHPVSVTAFNSSSASGIRNVPKGNLSTDPLRSGSDALISRMVIPGEFDVLVGMRSGTKTSTDR